MSFTSPQARAPRWRDVHLVASARAVSYCGDFLAATALALNLQTRGDNGYGVAALLVAGALPVALLAPVAGRLADRFDSRTLLVATSAAQAAVCLALAFTGDPVLMIALVAVISAGLAITQTTMSALVPDMVGKENLPKAMSISQTAGAVGMLLGPALGGLLVGSYGVRLPLLLDAASYLALAGAAVLIRTRRGGVASGPASGVASGVVSGAASGVASGVVSGAAQASAAGGLAVPAPLPAEELASVRLPVAPSSVAPSSVTPSPLAPSPLVPSSVVPSSVVPSPVVPSTGVRASVVPSVAWRIRDDRLLVTLMAAFGAVIAAVTAVNVVEIFFVRETLGGSETMYGLVSASWTLGVLVGAWPWGRSRGDDRKLVSTQLFLLGGISALVLISATVPSALWLLPLYLCGGLLNAGLNVLSGVVVGRRAPSHLRGRVFGVFSSIGNTADMAGYLAGGALLPLAAPRSIILGTGIAGLFVAALFLLPVVVFASRRTVTDPAAVIVG